MRKIVLVECASKQNIGSNQCRAKDLYTSQLFIKSLAYARTLTPNAIYILSSKYGLLSLEDEVKPYNVILKKSSIQNRREWARNVLASLKKVSDLENDEYIFLTGKTCLEFLVDEFDHYSDPLNGLRIGERMKWLNENTIK